MVKKLNLVERKEEIKKIAVREKSNGGFIYQMIERGNLDHLIEKITDKRTKTFYCSFTPKGYLSGTEQFVDVLCEFIHYFDSSFAPLTYKYVFLSALFEKRSPEFLLCKKYWGNNKYIQYYQYNIRKFLVENMYDNIKFIYSDCGVKSFFNSLGINDKLSLKREKDVDKLFNFMKEIVWCNYNEYSLSSVFYNYKTLIETYKKHDGASSDIINYVWNNVELHWSMMISNYKSKINSVKEILR